MKASVIGLLAETSLHPGTESSTGVVDLPVAREAATGYPVIVGSSLKGALKDNVQQSLPEEIIKKIFGEQNSAGAIAITDARILLLPVRSLTGHYKWVSCPYLLERFQRDLNMAGIKCELPPIRPKAGQAMAKKSGSLFLEELSFEAVEAEASLSTIAKEIAQIIKHQSCRERLLDQLVILCDDDFSYFASYGMQINARNQLNDKTKISENLWYEETIPADSLFYALLISRSGEKESLNELKQHFTETPYLQVGGNETVGQGWCAVSWLEEGGSV